MALEIKKFPYQLDLTDLAKAQYPNSCIVNIGIDDLLNVPSLVGQAGKVLQVNSAETLMEFVAGAGSGGLNFGAIFPVAPSNNDLYLLNAQSGADLPGVYQYNGVSWDLLLKYTSMLDAGDVISGVFSSARLALNGSEGDFLVKTQAGQTWSALNFSFTDLTNTPDNLLPGLILKVNQAGDAIILASLDSSDIPSLNANKITTGTLDSEVLATGGSVGQVLTKTADGQSWSASTGGTGGGASTFLALLDTPFDFVGGSFLKTNSAGTALENATLKAGDILIDVFASARLATGGVTGQVLRKKGSSQEWANDFSIDFNALNATPTNTLKLAVQEVVPDALQNYDVTFIPTGSGSSLYYRFGSGYGSVSPDTSELREINYFPTTYTPNANLRGRLQIDFDSVEKFIAGATPDKVIIDGTEYALSVFSGDVYVSTVLASDPLSSTDLDLQINITFTDGTYFGFIPGSTTQKTLNKTTAQTWLNVGSGGGGGGASAFADLTGQIATSQIPDNAITDAKIASSFITGVTPANSYSAIKSILEAGDDIVLTPNDTTLKILISANPNANLTQKLVVDDVSYAVDGTAFNTVHTNLGIEGVFTFVSPDSTILNAIGVDFYNENLAGTLATEEEYEFFKLLKSYYDEGAPYRGVVLFESIDNPGKSIEYHITKFVAGTPFQDTGNPTYYSWQTEGAFYNKVGADPVGAEDWKVTYFIESGALPSSGGGASAFSDLTGQINSATQIADSSIADGKLASTFLKSVTQQNAANAIGAVLQGGTNISIDFGDSPNTISINSTATGGSSTFIGLLDTPGAYNSNNPFLKKNSAGTGLDFVSLLAEDIPDLDVAKITSGVFDSERLATGGLLDQVLSKTASGQAWKALPATTTNITNQITQTIETFATPTKDISAYKYFQQISSFTAPLTAPVTTKTTQIEIIPITQSISAVEINNPFHTVFAGTIHFTDTANGAVNQFYEIIFNFVHFAGLPNEFTTPRKISLPLNLTTAGFTFSIPLNEFNSIAVLNSGSQGAESVGSTLPFRCYLTIEKKSTGGSTLPYSLSYEWDKESVSFYQLRQAAIIEQTATPLSQDAGNVMGLVDIGQERIFGKTGTAQADQYLAFADTSGTIATANPTADITSIESKEKGISSNLLAISSSGALQQFDFEKLTSTSTLQSANTTLTPNSGWLGVKQLSTNLYFGLRSDGGVWKLSYDQSLNIITQGLKLLDLGSINTGWRSLEKVTDTQMIVSATGAIFKLLTYSPEANTLVAEDLSGGASLGFNLSDLVKIKDGKLAFLVMNGLGTAYQIHRGFYDLALKTITYDKVDTGTKALGGYDIITKLDDENFLLTRGFTLFSHSLVYDESNDEMNAFGEKTLSLGGNWVGATIIDITEEQAQPPKIVTADSYAGSDFTKISINEKEYDLTKSTVGSTFEYSTPAETPGFTAGLHKIQALKADDSYTFTQDVTTYGKHFYDGNAWQKIKVNVEITQANYDLLTNPNPDIIYNITA